MAYPAPATARTSATVLGLDLSLTATGVAGNAGGGWATVIKPPAKLRGHERMAYIRGQILDLHLPGVDLVAIEGPSYGSQAGQAGHHERAGLFWLVTHYLWAEGRPFAVIPPATVKKYATGRGNAGKDDIMREVARRFPWFGGDNNAADATVLAAAAAEHLGVPMVLMPADRRAALAAVDWPELRWGAA
jgi:Holliday junction resolvasome RuvABC endonuclease subunit